MSVPRTSRASTVAVEDISRAILVLRGHKVLLDAELAALYGVDTRVLLQAVKRNLELTAAEWAALRSQIGDGLRISVEGMTVAFDCRSQTNEGCCPEPEGCRVGASAAAAQHLSNETAHGFDTAGSEWQAASRVRQVRAVDWP